MLLQVQFRLEGVLPGEFGVEGAAGHVELQLQRLDVDHAFDQRQLRAGEKGVGGGQVRAQLACQAGIPPTGVVAQAHQQAASALTAEGGDQLAAQVGEQAAVGEQHPLLVHPDLALFGIEADLCDQVAAGGKLWIGTAGHFCSCSYVSSRLGKATTRASARSLHHAAAVPPLPTDAFSPRLLIFATRLRKSATGGCDSKSRKLWICIYPFESIICH
ncbi:hypothetical protein D3C78_758370 [compost metagenome]